MRRLKSSAHNSSSFLGRRASACFLCPSLHFPWQHGRLRASCIPTSAASRDASTCQAEARQTLCQPPSAPPSPSPPPPLPSAEERPCEGGAYACECGELRQLRASMLTKGEREWSRHFTLCDMLGRGGDGGFCQMLIPSSAASLSHHGRGLTGSDSQVFLPVG